MVVIVELTGKVFAKGVIVDCQTSPRYLYNIQSISLYRAFVVTGLPASFRM